MQFGVASYDIQGCTGGTVSFCHSLEESLTVIDIMPNSTDKSSNVTLAFLLTEMHVL